MKVGATPVTSLAAFYRALWRLGDAGVDVPLTLEREDDAFNLTLRSSDRARFSEIGAPALSRGPSGCFSVDNIPAAAARVDTLHDALVHAAPTLGTNKVWGFFLRTFYCPGKGGPAKSTLAAHLSVHAARPSRADPPGRRRPAGLRRSGTACAARRKPALVRGTPSAGDRQIGPPRGLRMGGSSTPPDQVGAGVVEAIRLATLVIVLARPGVFDLAAVRDTIELRREPASLYCVVMNGQVREAPRRRRRRRGADSPGPRRRQHPGLVRPDHPPGRFLPGARSRRGRGATGPGLAAAAEMAQLWSAVDRSVKAINGLTKAAAGCTSWPRRSRCGWRPRRLTPSSSGLRSGSDEDRRDALSAPPPRAREPGP